MARLLPSSLDPAPVDDSGPRVIGVEESEADDLLSAMSSETARDLLAALHESPAAPSELTDRADTSLQNVQYHLSNLEDAGAIDVVDTVYSEKGREMKLYAPADKPLVVVAGDEAATTGLKSTLTSLLGGLGILGIVSVLIQWVVERTGTTTGAGAAPPADAGGQAGIMAAPTPTPTPAAGTSGVLLDLLVEPGVLFFAGGAIVLLAAVLYRTARAG